MLVWDGWQVHRGRRVRAFLEARRRIHVEPLPPYAPELNPVEHIWRVVKQRVAANLTRTVDSLKAAYRSFFDDQSAQDLLRTASLTV